MLTTNDISLIVYNSGDMLELINKHLYNTRMLFVVEVAEDVWNNNGLRWNYSDRIVVTLSPNVKPNWVNNSEMKFIRYQDLTTISHGIQQSILNQLKRKVKKWQNA